MGYVNPKNNCPDNFYNGQSYPALMIDNVRDLGSYVQIDVAIASEYYYKYRESRIYNHMSSSNPGRPSILYNQSFRLCTFLYQSLCQCQKGRFIHIMKNYDNHNHHDNNSHHSSNNNHNRRSRKYQLTFITPRNIRIVPTQLSRRPFTVPGIISFTGACATRLPPPIIPIYSSSLKTPCIFQALKNI